MQRLADASRLYAPTDLVNFLECEHLCALDRIDLDTPRERAPRDETAELFGRKGDAHERAHVARLRASGLDVIDIAEGGGSLDDKVARTLAAMRGGAAVIYQAALREGALAGHADFLRRVNRSSALCAWSYEAVDTKLARTPKAKFLVQLACYSHLIERAQGAAPLAMHLVLGDGTEHSARYADHAHYFRSLLARFLAFVEGEPAATAPLPCMHCKLCDWRLRCEAEREAVDHLCQVADIRRTQVVKLQAGGITTLGALAALQPSAVVPRLNAETLVKLRSQARLQAEARASGEHRVALLSPDARGQRGFQRLPAPDAADMYFDMEGDPLEDGGLEYLFGVGYRDLKASGAWRYRSFRAHDRAEERLAFEQCIDFIVARRHAHPHAHVYHYASYEDAALKRLANRHATREAEHDDLLRTHALVDLYKVVRESMRTSQPGYSIKDIERFYRAARAGEVKSAGASMVVFDRWRETGDPALLAGIEAYNRDDVESTLQLHDWLLGMRPAGLPWAAPPAAPDTSAGATARALTKEEQRLLPYRRALIDALPADRQTWSDAQRMQELTYQLLDFHRREKKPEWWRMYARMELDEDELIEDVECLAGLVRDDGEPPLRVKQSLLYTYTVPEQETKLKSGDPCTRADTSEAMGELEYDEAARRAGIKVGPSKPVPPERLSLGPGKPIADKVLADAVFRFADSLIDGEVRYPAIESVLRRELPRLQGRRAAAPVVAEGSDVVRSTREAVQAMQRTHLYIQGPPGAGKTRTGARLIVDLLVAGKRIGITSNSHKAINHLLGKVVDLARDERVAFRGCKKTGGAGTAFEGAGIDDVGDNAEALCGGYQLVAGTAWLFARTEADRTFDHLFIDEAGQVSLANLIAAGTCARNIVLLGDQMQLGQPIQGVHPGQSGNSVLDFLLDGAATIAPERGVFLPTSWRMHPALCDFISQAVYDGRLKPEARNARRTLRLRADAHPLLRAAGVVHAPIAHSGCRQSSSQEARLVAELYASLLAQRYTDEDGAEHPMSAANVLVVAPYNMQVNLLCRTLPAGARVGTVDKFQGQEAEVVIVSMTTSSGDDVPRGIEFLYSRQRLNVAISRAKCLAIVIANPALMSIKCHTPEQMALVNTLCALSLSALGREPG